MKLYCTLLVVATTAVLSVPSLLGNAFLVGNGRQITALFRAVVAPVAVVHILHESSQTALSSSESESESWLDNNDIIADSIFDTIDTDQDGSITNNELHTYLKGQNFGYKNNDNTITESKIRFLFATLDTNMDGLISRDEMRFAFTNYDIHALYQAFGMIGSTSTNEKEYTKAINTIRSNANLDRRRSSSLSNVDILADCIFDKIDTDQSGEIDANELKEHFVSLTTTMNASTTSTSTTTNITRDDDYYLSAESILQALDLNLDGVISREEMRLG
eukprot:CAMPEP_0171055408 /NCGR_PEP_ID=MMETSP0736-20130129/55760_1 /TAXON_ID=186038 /ORGANISM="Fragilariopsis kerguelensis, Strain L26-C5" /LENGTH=274 /DNA_ID=CAMNT_0011509929 /DNA_START=14 /DNA_END=836 /DNA_ORIENTATION=-